MKILAGNKMVEGNEIRNFKSGPRTIIEDQLYHQILDYTALACVDVVAYLDHSPSDRVILMVERAEKPVQGMLWLPGGRLYKNEPFEAAARRKLREECGLEEITIERQIGAFPFSCRSEDAIYGDLKEGFHAIGIDYVAQVSDKDSKIKLDHTSKGYRWMDEASLRNLEQGLHPYIAEVLNAAQIFSEPFTNINYSFER
ncbi:MAG: NUDIX domain-containing protein [Nanoarchaeota archaeon]|nr:NUDIX domain-containing protein [Nanoarchaeota archaeon]